MPDPGDGPTHPPSLDLPYQRLFESSPDAIVVADDDGRYVDANVAACSLFGVPRERLLGARIADFADGRDGAQIQARYSAFVRDGAERGEFKLRRPDGEVRTLEYVAVAGFMPGRHASFLRDVTARKAAEQLAGKFQTLIENSTDFIGFATLAGEPIYINRAGLTMIGLSSLDDARQQRVIDFHLDEDKPFVLSTIIPEVLQSGRWEGEFRFRNFATGAAIPVFYTFFRIDDPATGEASCIATVTRDITGTLRQRQALEASARELRRITEIMPQMVWTTTPDGTHTYFNKRWTDYTGLSLQKSRGWGWQDVLHPDDLARTTEVWSHSLQTGSDYQIEYRMRGRDGLYRWQLARAQPLRDDKGKILQWFGTCTDIEPQKKLQELLQATQTATERERKRLFAMFMDAPLFIKVVRGPELRIEFTNRLYQKMFGRPLDGLPFEGALPEVAPALVATHRQVLESGQPRVERELAVTFDYDRNGKPYERLWHANYEPLRDEAGAVTAVMTFAFDVTEQVRARKHTAELIARLEQERELREQFVSALTHDLRTPLSAARMSAQIIARSVGEPDRVQRNSARLMQNLDRADGMIRDLLDAHLIRAGERLPIHAAACDLHQLVREALDELAAVHGDRFEFESEGPVIGYWDGGSLQRVLENLCNNAIKYGSEHDKVTVRLRELPADEVELSVRNRGNPLSEAEQKELFRSFHRAPAVRSSRISGWGIGLTLVKGVVEAHAGVVSVASSATEGTLFTVRVPRDARRP